MAIGGVMETLSIGIDPGKTGAIAMIHSSLGLIQVKSMPLKEAYGTKEVDYECVKAELQIKANKIKVNIEDLSNIPKSWQFLKEHYNKLNHILYDIFRSNQIIHVHCKSWRKLAEYTAHLPKGTTKQRSIKCAEYIFSNAELDLMRKKRGPIDHNKADASLIAYYGLNR